MRRALAVSAIGAAVLMLIAGCAATDAVRSGRYRIEPVLDVTDSAASTDAWYAAGRFYDASRDWDHAIGAYRKALIADPKNVEAYNALGVALAQRGEFSASEAAFRSALDLEPARAHLRSNLGYVLYLAGRPREAVTELKLALRADRGDTTALNNLRSALARLDAAEAPPAASAAQAQTPPDTELPTIVVVGTTPLVGVGTPLEKVPANVQTIKGSEIEAQHTPTIANYLEKNVVSVDTEQVVAPHTVPVAYLAH